MSWCRENDTRVNDTIAKVLDQSLWTLGDLYKRSINRAPAEYTDFIKQCVDDLESRNTVNYRVDSNIANYFSALDCSIDMVLDMKYDCLKAAVLQEI